MKAHLQKNANIDFFLFGMLWKKGAMQGTDRSPGLATDAEHPC